jgi:NodT family efflux transporter outer membrane factor (OMF) lipoprotein
VTIRRNAPTRGVQTAARVRLLIATAVLAAALSGCTVGEDYSPPRVVSSGGWAELAQPLPATRPTELPSSATTRPVSVAEWWTTFSDPALNELIAQAIRSNHDLRLAESRIREARGQRGVVAGRLYPQVNADGTYLHSRVSETGVPIPGASVSGGGQLPDITPRRPPASGNRAAGDGSSSGGSGGSGTSSIFGFGRDFDLFQIGFDAAWEVDVFGGTRRSVEAAEADIAARVEDRRSVLVSLMAEVARNYLELRGAQRQLAIARDTLGAQQRTLQLTQDRRQAGVATDLDVARATSQVATTAATIPGFNARARAAIHRLGVLVGREPSALSEQLNPVGPVPGVPAEVPVGLPSELLRRRPDVRRAERELAAATARTGAATADLFPRFALTGNVGLQSLSPDKLFRGESVYSAIGPSINWPIFDAGRIRSNIQVQTERQEQALIRYQQAVLQALQDVEDALTNYASEQIRRQSLAEAVAADRRAVDVAQDRYRQGVVDFLTVLDAQRSLFRTQDALAESDRIVSTNLVALYKALGGGWEPPGEAQARARQ